MIRLIKAGIGDAERIHAMQTAAFRALLEKYKDYDTNPGAEKLDDTILRFRDPSVSYYFICLDNAEIGVIRISEYGDRLMLRQIFILPDYRGHGYARAAIRLAEALYPNAAEWRLDTILQEEKLCRLYEEMGYSRTGETERIREGMDLVYFVKRV